MRSWTRIWEHERVNGGNTRMHSLHAGVKDNEEMDDGPDSADMEEERGCT